MLMGQHHHSLSVSRWEKLLEYELERTHPQLYLPTVSLHPDPWCVSFSITYEYDRGTLLKMTPDVVKVREYDT